MNVCQVVSACSDPKIERFSPSFRIPPQSPRCLLNVSPASIMQKQVAVPCRHSSAYCVAAISKGSKQTRASAVLSANTYLICAHQSLTCHIDSISMLIAIIQPPPWLDCISPGEQHSSATLAVMRCSAVMMINVLSAVTLLRMYANIGGIGLSF